MIDSMKTNAELAELAEQNKFSAGSAGSALIVLTGFIALRESVGSPSGGP
jgi:hypothetical protein